MVRDITDLQSLSVFFAKKRSVYEFNRYRVPEYTESDNHYDVILESDVFSEYEHFICTDTMRSTVYIERVSIYHIHIAPSRSLHKSKSAGFEAWIVHFR